MEHCPKCGRDCPCTTIGYKISYYKRETHPEIVYRCIECHIEWPPNRPDLREPIDGYSRSGLLL